MTSMSENGHEDQRSYFPCFSECSVSQRCGPGGCHSPRGDAHEWLESQPNATEVPSKRLELSGGYREGATKSRVYTLRSGIKP